MGRDEIYSDRSELLKSYYLDDHHLENRENQIQLNDLLRKYNIPSQMETSREEHEMQSEFTTTRRKFLKNKVHVNIDVSNISPTNVVKMLRHNEMLSKLVGKMDIQIERNQQIDHVLPLVKEQKAVDSMPEVVVLPIVKDPKKTISRMSISRIDGKIISRVVKSIYAKAKLMSGNSVFRVYEADASLVRPTARAKMATIRSDSSLIIINGFSSKIVEDIWVGTFEDSTERVKIKWEKVIYMFSKYEALYGQTAVKILNSIFMFGGANTEGLNDKIFCYEEGSKSITIRKNLSKIDPVARKMHVSAAVGMDLFVHGGYDIEGKVICSAMFFDVVLDNWHNIFFENGELYLAEHACCAINSLKNKTQDMNLYNLTDFFQSTSHYRKKAVNDGIFMFGGFNSKGKINDTLYQIHFGSYPLFWTEVKAQGEPPIGAVGAKLDYFSEMQSLILTGGLDKKFDKIYLYLFERKSWLKVNLYGSKVRSTAYHASGILGDKLILFGGMSNEHFAGSTVYVIDLSVFLKRSS